MCGLYEFGLYIRLRRYNSGAITLPESSCYATILA